MENDVKQDFSESLQDLTINSRPVIKTLTEIALDYAKEGYATAIADAIDIHIRRCAPPFKLPVFYLLDSICKSQPEVFAGIFAPRVASLFRSSFPLLPESTKVKLDELFRTWTMPLPQNGLPLFPHEVLREISDFLAAASGRKPMPQNNQPMMAPPPKLNQSSMLVEINRLIRTIENGPQDHVTEKQIARLHHLESDVTGPVDPKIFPTVLQNLEAIRADYTHYINRPRRNPPNKFADTRKSGNRRDRGPSSRGSNYDNQPRQDNQKNKPRNRQNLPESQRTGTNNVPLGSSKRRAPDGSQDGSSDPAQHGSSHGNNQSADGQVEDSYQFENDLGVDPRHSHEGNIAAKKLQTALESLHIDLETAVKDPAPISLIEELLYTSMPLQCATCGKRFPDTQQGRKNKEAEMDWHFRVNKDLREGHSRNRCWFLSAAKWASYREDEGTVGEAHAGDGDTNTDAPAIDLEAEKAKYVLVPSDPSAVCPVCQDKHQSAWSDDAEDWVWTNCVLVDGKYFHATCYADPQNQKIVEAILGETVKTEIKSEPDHKAINQTVKTEAIKSET